MTDETKLGVLTEQVVLLMQQIQRISKTVIEMKAQSGDAHDATNIGDLSVTSNVHSLQFKRRHLNSAMGCCREKYCVGAKYIRPTMRRSVPMNY